MTRHILSAKQFERQEVLKLFEDSRKLNQLFKQHRVIDIAGDRILMTVFLEPSTRTRLSFTFAMKRFGGMVI
ncbi:MAG: hypothetical protein QXR47_06360, partial [Candidatus Caldarchaeum sp.]